jgi:phosphatidylinositol alpha-1,6-mannosyltransferase
MKTLLLTYDYPPAIGGIANVMETFWRLAGSSGSVILAPRISGAEEYDRNHAVTIIRYPVLNRLGKLGKTIDFVLALIWTIVQILSLRPDIFIAGQLVRAGPIAHIWHKATGRPYYIWIYGGESSKNFIAVPGLTRYLHRVLRSAALLITISSFTTREMLAFGVPQKHIIEIKCGVDHELFFPSSKDQRYEKQYNLAGKLVFLTLGRLVKRKGVDIFLKVLNSLAPSLPPWHYLVVGDGPYRKELAALTADLGLRDHVTFTGSVEDAKLPVFYNLCDVFVMLNRQVFDDANKTLSVEGFGIVFIEAAACGKPVIAGRSGGAVDAVADGINGILVNPTDIEEIKQAIIALLDTAKRERMGKNGIALASHFDWDKSAKILGTYI